MQVCRKRSIYRSSYLVPAKKDVFPHKKQMPRIIVVGLRESALSECTALFINASSNELRIETKYTSQWTPSREVAVTSSVIVKGSVTSIETLANNTR